MPRASCLCGSVQYEYLEPFQAMLHCHCSICRRHFGTTFSTVVAVPAQHFRLLAGAESIRRHASPAPIERAFCGRCGSPVPSGRDDGTIVGPAGGIVDPIAARPQAHLFAGSRAGWYPIADALAQFDTWPPGIDGPVLDRPAFLARPGIAEGGCLCGEIHYEIHGPPMRIWDCHCSRCRRARGAAHATNVFYSDRDFRWTRGEALLGSYRPPDARHYTAVFCTRCGGKLPRVAPDRHLVVVPAGSMDTDPGIGPSAHIFVGSKASWFEIADARPRFEEMPPA
ncbi:MAG: GFA family protein [Gammaproteobacteria bacterium]